jgi:uncharacterized protein YyaL (SSP411 family)
MLPNIIATIEYPSANSNWMHIALNYSKENKELCICGEKAFGFGSKINNLYLPNIVLAGTEKASDLPLLTDRFVANHTLFYLCQNRSCVV